MNISFTRAISALPSLAMIALGAVAADAATISLKTNSTGSTSRAYYQQGITIGAGTDWKNISFAFDKRRGRGFSAYAAGDLFILKGRYNGTPNALSSSHARFVAQSTGISNGLWRFDSGVTLQANETYYFVMGDRNGAVATRIYGSPNGSQPGWGYSEGSNSRYRGYPSDLDHVLRGKQMAPVPLPATALLLILGLGGLGAASSRRRKS